jgi:hypothetical protein
MSQMTDSKLDKTAQSNSVNLGRNSGLSAAGPLWNHVPTRDSEGQRLSDFMMLIPNLRSRPQAHLKHVLQQLQEVLEFYQHAVVFADLNLRLNVLWVSVKPIPGICLELPSAILARIPEARLVAQPPRRS